VRVTQRSSIPWDEMPELLQVESVNVCTAK